MNLSQVQRRIDVQKAQLQRLQAAGASHCIFQELPDNTDEQSNSRLSDACAFGDASSLLVQNCILSC